jgi:hypothetical protein
MFRIQTPHTSTLNQGDFSGNSGAYFFQGAGVWFAFSAFCKLFSCMILMDLVTDLGAGVQPQLTVGQ